MTMIQLRCATLDQPQDFKAQLSGFDNLGARLARIDTDQAPTGLDRAHPRLDNALTAK